MQVHRDRRHQAGNNEFGQAEGKSTERKNVDDGWHKDSVVGEGRNPLLQR